MIAPAIGAAVIAGVALSTVTLTVEKARRDAIQRHHTVTHLLHWALHEVVSKEASQKGSFVGPDKLTFDFNSAALTPAQVADIERLVNERIVENAGVSWTEVPHADVKSRKDVMQFFGDKYGDTVRVVQIGGAANKLDGYSMELCGGTHTRATGEIGLFRIVGENAIAAGVRRIEAVAGLTAFDAMRLDRELIRTVAGKVKGSEPTTTQQMTCCAGMTPDTLAPATYAMEVDNTASSSQPSAAASRPPPFQAAKLITNAHPASAQAQNPAEGRWRSVSAPTTAVPRGMMPVTTAACMDSTSRSAKAMHSGKPTTVPRAHTANGRQCCSSGTRAPTQRK